LVGQIKRETEPDGTSRLRIGKTNRQKQNF
jgi:hypothetical protein